MHSTALMQCLEMFVAQPQNNALDCGAQQGPMDDQTQIDLHNKRATALATACKRLACIQAHGLRIEDHARWWCTFVGHAWTAWTSLPCSQVRSAKHMQDTGSACIASDPAGTVGVPCTFPCLGVAGLLRSRLPLHTSAHNSAFRQPLPRGAA